MMRDIIGYALVGMVYLGFLVVIFGPTIYVGWLYVMGRKVKLKARGLLRLAISVFCINAVVAYFVIKLAFECFLTAKVTEWQDLTRTTIRNAIASEERFFKSHGRYYEIGPVRGPYQDQYGLSVAKDVILEVVPFWDKHAEREAFKAHAVHVLAKGLHQGTREGNVDQIPSDSAESRQIKSRLFNSVK